VNVTGLDKDYAALVEGVVLRIKEMGLQVRAILEDREFSRLASPSFGPNLQTPV
jgi:hypothetical protein